MRYILFITTSLLLFFSVIAYGAPSVFGVTGTTILTINGVNFGSKSTAAPIKYDSFEWGIVGEEIDTGSDPVIPRWQKAGTGGATINNTKYHSGSQSAYKAMTYNSTNCAFYDSYIDVTSTEELYVSYWLYWDTADGLAFSEDGAFFKFSRINSGGVPYSGYPNMLLNLTANYDDPETGYVSVFNYVDDGNVFNDDRPPTALVPEHGGWHRIEMWMKLSSPAGATNGELEYAIDSVPVVVTGHDSPWLGVTRASGSTNNIDVFTLLFGGCRFTATSYPLLWQDDIYVDSTRARVEVCNNPTKTDATHCEVQPSTAWSATEITTTLNQGSFNPGDTVYAFVIDADNVPSAGFQFQLAKQSRNTNIGQGTTGNVGSGATVNIH